MLGLGTDWEAVAQGVEVEPTPQEKDAARALGYDLSAPRQRNALLPMDAIGPNTSTVGKWKQPPKRGEGDLLAAYASSPPFRAVVNRVANSFGAVEFYHAAPNDIRDTAHPAISLLNNYNPHMVGSQGRELEQIYLDITGDAVTIMAPTAGERRVELYPVPSTWVTLDTKAGRLKYVVRMGREEYEFDPEFVIHQREINPADPYGRGRGPGWAAADEIQSDEYIAKHVGSYFYNGTRPEFIGVLKNLTQEQLTSFSEEWDSAHRGFRRQWRPAWLNVDVDLKEITGSIGESAIRELRDSHLEMIQWLYGVPPEVLGRVTNSNRATIKEAKEMMGTYVLDPRCRRRRDVWQLLCDDLFDGAPISYVSPIPREFDRRDEIMSRHPYAFTRNEIRREAGFEDVSDGDLYPVPSNIEMQQASRSISRAGRQSVVLEIVDGGRTRTEEAG